MYAKLAFALSALTILAAATPTPVACLRALIFLLAFAAPAAASCPPTPALLCLYTCLLSRLNSFCA